MNPNDSVCITLPLMNCIDILGSMPVRCYGIAIFFTKNT